MPENAGLRVATYNIRNIRAIDRDSWWWRRRNRLGAAIRAVDADVWGLQEVYRAQSDWLDAHVFGNGWDHFGQGRNRGGGGEMCPVWARCGRLEITDGTARWYGATPTRPGSLVEGARFPRLASLVEVRGPDGVSFVVANTHLDERSTERRRDSLTQLATWLRCQRNGRPIIVMGDLNCTLNDPPIEALRVLGLKPVLAPGDGPTANDFGRNPNCRQIDHIFVSDHWTINTATVVREAGHSSDHWPVVAELFLQSSESHRAG